MDPDSSSGGIAREARNVRPRRQVALPSGSLDTEPNQVSRYQARQIVVLIRLYEERQFGTVVRVTSLLSLGCCGIHGLSPIARRGSLPNQIQLIYGRCSRQRHQHPACGGQGSGGQDHSSLRPFQDHAYSRLVPPGSARIDRVLEDLQNSVRLTHQAVFMIAPSMMTPALTYFHSATSSLRASVTIVDFFRRPPLCLTGPGTTR